MAARVTQDEVRTNTQSPATTDASIAVRVANVLVQQYLMGKGVAEDLLTQIELMLASHFLTLSKGKSALGMDKIGEAEERYHNIYKAGLNATVFGQQAILLDPSGILGALSSNAINPMLPALFTTVGSPPTTDPDFDETTAATAYWPY